METSQADHFVSIAFNEPRIGVSPGLREQPFIARLSEQAQIVSLPAEGERMPGADEVDGFIVASGSEADRVGRAVAQHHGPLAVVTDAQLQDAATRHHFLTRVFAFAELRGLKEDPSRAALTDFQRRHKHVLMTYNQHQMRALGAIAAEATPGNALGAYQAYAQTFREALRKRPAHEAWANAAQHMYGHFKQKLPADEKADFLKMLADYRAEVISFEAVLAPLRDWCARYEYDYFTDQTLLEPYPRELGGPGDYFHTG